MVNLMNTIINVVTQVPSDRPWNNRVERLWHLSVGSPEAKHAFKLPRIREGKLSRMNQHWQSEGTTPNRGCLTDISASSQDIKRRATKVGKENTKNATKKDDDDDSPRNRKKRKTAAEEESGGDDEKQRSQRRDIDTTTSPKTLEEEEEERGKETVHVVAKDAVVALSTPFRRRQEEPEKRRQHHSRPDRYSARRKVLFGDMSGSVHITTPTTTSPNTGKRHRSSQDDVNTNHKEEEEEIVKNTEFPNAFQVPLCQEDERNGAATELSTLEHEVPLVTSDDKADEETAPEFYSDENPDDNKRGGGTNNITTNRPAECEGVEEQDFLVGVGPMELDVHPSQAAKLGESFNEKDNINNNNNNNKEEPAQLSYSQPCTMPIAEAVISTAKPIVMRQVPSKGHAAKRDKAEASIKKPSSPLPLSAHENLSRNHIKHTKAKNKKVHTSSNDKASNNRGRNKGVPFFTSPAKQTTYKEGMMDGVDFEVLASCLTADEMKDLQAAMDNAGVSAKKVYLWTALDDEHKYSDIVVGTPILLAINKRGLAMVGRIYYKMRRCEQLSARAFPSYRTTREPLLFVDILARFENDPIPKKEVGRGFGYTNCQWDRQVRYRLWDGSRVSDPRLGILDVLLDPTGTSGLLCLLERDVNNKIR